VPARGRLQDALQRKVRFSAAQSQIGRAHAGPAAPFRPTPPLGFRTHVPRADDPPTEQALAPRAGARCRGNGTGVRDAGRGNARSRTCVGGGNRAVSGAHCAAGRPHRRPPAPPANRPSAIQAQERNAPSAPTGLPRAGTSLGEQAGLTARRRPVWEDGSAGRPGALPGAPVFIASRAALTGRLECGGAIPQVARLNRHGGPWRRSCRRRLVRRPPSPGRCRPRLMQRRRPHRAVCRPRLMQRRRPHRAARVPCARRDTSAARATVT
jgi:hypothetical protein